MSPRNVFQRRTKINYACYTYIKDLDRLMVTKER